jgi:hypothetical protein
MEEFFAEVTEERSFLSMDRSIACIVGTIKGLKVPTFTHDMYADEAGRVRIDLKVDEKLLPETAYLALATPMKVDGKLGNESEAKAALAVAAGLFALHTGLNTLRDLLFDGETNAKGGTFSHPGEPWKMPQRCEGPFLGRQNGQDIQEIAQCVSRLSEPQRGRISLALRLVDRGMRDGQGFFEYWTALEVLCDGKAPRIKDKLARLYMIRNHREASDRLGFTMLEKWRHDYIHRGRTPPLTADVERYFQLLFLDLLRQALGLPFRAHLAGMQGAVGYDLSPIGLADTRTEEEKQETAVPFHDRVIPSWPTDGPPDPSRGKS